MNFTTQYEGCCHCQLLELYTCAVATAKGVQNRMTSALTMSYLVFAQGVLLFRVLHYTYL